MLPFDWSYKPLATHPAVDEICCALTQSIVSSNDQTRSYTSEALPSDQQRDIYEIAIDHLKKNFLNFDILNGSLHKYEFSITHDNRIQVDVTSQGYVPLSKKRSHALEVQPLKARRKEFLEIGDIHTQEDFDQVLAIFDDRLLGYDLDFDFEELPKINSSTQSKFKSLKKFGYTHYLFCCRIDGEIVGALYAKSYIARGNTSRNTMELSLISVKRGFDGKQIGSTLLNEVKLLAKQTECISLELDSVSSALPFYKKYGFRIRDIPSIGKLNQSDRALISKIQQMGTESLEEVGQLFLEYAIGANIRTTPNSLAKIGRFIIKLANKVVDGDHLEKVYYKRLIKLFLNCLRNGRGNDSAKKFKRIGICKPLFSRIFKSQNWKHALDLDLWNLYQYAVDRYRLDRQTKLTQKLINFAVSLYCPNIQIDDHWSEKDLDDCASKLNTLGIPVNHLELPLT